MRPNYTTTFHVNLPDKWRTPNTPLTLHANGREYAIRAHSSETLGAHRSKNSALAVIPQSHLFGVTHFVENVELPSDAVGLYYVTQPARDPGALIGDMVVAGLHIPRQSRAIAARRRLRENQRRRLPAVLAQLGVNPAVLESAEADAILLDAALIPGPLETAKLILFQHPELASVNPEIAADIHEYIDEALDIYDDLWRYISTHGPSSSDPWQKNTQAVHADGSPFEPPDDLLDKDGQPIPWPTDSSGKKRVPQFELSEGTVAAAKTALDYVLQKTKDTPKFHGVVWQRAQGTPCTQDKRGVVVQNPAPRSMLQNDGLGNSTDVYRWTLANPGSGWGLDISDDISFDGDTQQITIRITNKANRCLGAYVQFLNSNGDAIEPKGWPDRISIPEYQRNPTKKYLNFIRPSDCVFGIPMMSRETAIGFPFIEGAVKAKILLGGLGTGADDGDVVALGRNTSAVLNYALPSMMIGFGVGMDSTEWFYSIFTNPTLLEALLGVLSSEGDFWLKTMDPSFFLRKAAGGIVTVLFSKALTFVAKRIVAKISGQQVADAAPIAGWVLRIMCLTSAAGMMISTTVAVTNAPCVYALDLSRALDVRVIVSPDPAHGGSDAVWPSSFDHYSLTLKHQNGIAQNLGPFDRKDKSSPLDHTFSNVAAGRGDNIQITVNLYAKNEWLCGAWISDWVAAVSTDGTTTITMKGNIIERLVPLNADTTYSHQSRLAVKDGKHIWKESSDAPSEVWSPTGSGPADHNLSKLVNITSNNHAFRIGYTWMASGQSLPLDKGTDKLDSQMYAFQGISTLADPEKGEKLPGRGFSVQPYMAFDQFGPAPLLILALSFQPVLDDPNAEIPSDMREAFTAAKHSLPPKVSKQIIKPTVEWNLSDPDESRILYVLKRRPSGIFVYPYPNPEFSARNFYLDPRGSGENQQHLRLVDLSDPSTNFDYAQDKSWGVFHQTNLDAIVVHPNGVVIGASYQNNKFEILKLDDEPKLDADATVAIPMSGAGTMEGLLGGPKGMTVTADGRVLVLEQTNKRVQAFDITGAPVQCFAGALSFDLDAKFTATLDAGTVSPELAAALQRVTIPDIAPRLYLQHEHTPDLNAGNVSESIRSAFSARGIALSAQASVKPIAPDALWLLEDPYPGLSFDVRAEDDETPVRSSARYSVEIQSKGVRWIVRDSTNVHTFRIQNDPVSGKLKGVQLVAVMGLRDSDDNLEYLDVACEPEGFIYVLSYLRPGEKLSDYRLDIYNPDGSHLTRTPKAAGDAGVNAAKISVDQWRTLFTLNYEAMRGPGGRTEPSISQWIPSVPKEE